VPEVNPLRSLAFPCSVALCLLACERSTPPAAASAGATASAPVATVTVAGAPAVPSAAGVNPSCALVPKVEAEAILGEALEDLAVTYGEMCDYRRKSDRRPLLGIKLYPNETRSQFESETANAAKIMKTELRPAPGYGEEAFTLGDIQIMVLAHGKAVSLTHASSPLEPTKRDALLKRALSRM